MGEAPPNAANQGRSRAGRRPEQRRKPIRLVVLVALAAAHLAGPVHHRHPHHRPTLGPEQSSRATYYSVPPCDRQGTQTASGQRVHFGVIASDWLPLYTRIRLDRPLFGRRDFQVLDTGAPFDVFLPCGPMTRGWSNPTLGFRVVLRR